MRILIMDAGRGTTGTKVGLWRDKLGLLPQDDVALLSWHPPKEPLPVVAHLVAGPAFHLGREPRRWRTASPAQAERAREQAAAAEHADPHDQLAQIPEPGQPVDEISEQFADEEALAVTDRAGAQVDSQTEEIEETAGPEPEAAAPLPDASACATSGFATSGAPGMAADRASAVQNSVTSQAPERSRPARLPRTDPRRLLHGLRWRANKVRMAARSQYRRGRSRMRKADEPASRAVRSVLRMHGSGIPNEFALAVAGSKDAARLFDDADVVVPVDDLTPRAAWLLAHRCPHPEVIHTFHAAKRVIAARRREGESTG